MRHGTKCSRPGACDFCTLVITSSILILNPYSCIVRFHCFTVSWISSLCSLRINTSSADVNVSSPLSLSLSPPFNYSNFIYHGSRCIALAWLRYIHSTVRTSKFCLNIVCTVAVYYLGLIPLYAVHRPDFQILSEHSLYGRYILPWLDSVICIPPSGLPNFVWT